MLRSKLPIKRIDFQSIKKNMRHDDLMKYFTFSTVLEWYTSSWYLLAVTLIPPPICFICIYV